MRLLIVGSLDGHMTTAGQIAMTRGAQVISADSVDTALIKLRAGQGADLALIDVRLPIRELVDQLEAERIHVPVVACGIEGTNAQAAVTAIKSGAKEYIPLPPDPELIAAVLEAVSQETKAVIHRDPVTVRVLKLAEQFAPSDASVLITGESGTGKEVFARYVHTKSRRASKPFVAVNCAAIPENLLESELFGHEKGAFSGAIARRVGKFEEASGGTLLLDEISEMDVRLQAKLLRAIQEREIDRVGGSKPVKVDVRILATSNRNMMASVKEGTFREDLYFRLNVVHLQLPSLRERPGDIAVLCDYFIKKYSESNGIEERPLSERALKRLEAHTWPGNVRELENTMHRAVLLGMGDEIGPEAIMISGEEFNPMPLEDEPVQTLSDTAAMTAPTQNASTPNDGEVMSGAEFQFRTVAEVERELIIDTLQHCLGNRTHAANILGISIRTLRNKLKQYGDEGFSFPAPGEA